MLDFVYVYHLDLIEKRVSEGRLHAVLAMVNGAEDVEIPDFEEARAEYDQALEAEPEPQTQYSRDVEDFLNVMIGRR